LDVCIVLHFNQWQNGVLALRYALVRQVAVQLPMFNERAVCQAIIDSACEMHWPSDRFCVQVGLKIYSLQKVVGLGRMHVPVVTLPEGVGLVSFRNWPQCC
jgi:hypothetical protein